MSALNAQLEMPAILPFRPLTTDKDFDRRLTLRDVYTEFLLQEISHQSPASLRKDIHCLTKWEKLTDNPDIREISRDHLIQLRDKMLSAGSATCYVNSIWRELKPIFEFARSLGLISCTPEIRYRMKSKLVEETPAMKREIITEEEVASLWMSCKHATYPTPAKSPIPAPKSFRVAIVLLWMYGQRREDLLALTWENIQFRSQIIKFRSQKTHLLQGLPMSQLVSDHLESIKKKSFHRGEKDRVFHNFRSKGSKLKSGKDNPGYCHTWKYQIVANSGVEPAITYKNFRETAATIYNRIAPDIGGWILGHKVRGVTAQYYENPTERICDAVASRSIPECFQEIQD